MKRQLTLGFHQIRICHVKHQNLHSDNLKHQQNYRSHYDALRTEETTEQSCENEISWI